MLYIMIELMFLKELMLIKQVNQKSDICDYWDFLNKGFKMSAMDDIIINDVFEP